MNLVLDLGNTALKWAIFDDKNLIFRGKLDYSNVVYEFPEWSKYDIKQVAVSTEIEIQNQLKKIFETFDSVLFINQNVSLPIKNSYQTPDSLGMDRLVNAVAARYLSNKQETLVVDCGTCLKIDLSTIENGFVGGSISPGITMRYEALHNFTHKLPLLKPMNFNKLTGVSTNDSIHNGVICGINNEILGSIENYKREFPDIHIIITGGDLSFLEKITEKKAIFAEPDLTLIGINLILLHNIQ
jgi:type III pantothenate kinase